MTTTPPPPTDLLPTLPGAARPDRRLIDHAVTHINRIYTARGMQMARELGEFVVQEFFGGDLGAAMERAGGHASWRGLASREDLLVSHSHLWSCVQVLGQLRRLPDAVGTALSVSHHRRLLVVKDEQTMARLAEEAVREGLSVKELEERVQAQRAREQRGERRGRKPLPGFVKAIHALRRVDLADGALTDEAVRALPPDESEALVETLSERIASLQAMRERIQAARG